MKSSIKSILLLAAALLMAACSSEQEIVQQEDVLATTGINAKVAAHDFIFGGNTRASVDYTGKFSWVAGDKIGIYSNQIGGTIQTTSQLMLNLNAGECTSTAYSTATGWSLVPGGKYNYVSYYPYAETSTREKIALDYSSQTQTANNSTAGVSACDYMYSNAAVPTDENNASFNFSHVGALVNVKITVPEACKNTTFKKCVLQSDDNILCSTASYSAESVLTSGIPTIENKKYGNITVSFGDAGFTPDNDGIVSVWFMTMPEDWKNKTITVKLYTDFDNNWLNPTNVSATFTPEDNLEAGHQYIYSISGCISDVPAQPEAGKSLHILLFGHSFGDDCTQYLPAITKAAGITNVHYGKFIQGNCSIKQHLGHFTAGDKYNYLDAPAGATSWSCINTTTKEILETYPWDIIIFQTSIGFSGEGNYDSYKDDFKTFREGVIKVCQDKYGKKPYIGWNMFWGFNSEATLPNGDLQYADYDRDATKMYEAIVSATKAMCADTDINCVIPTGTAIQNVRNALDPNWKTASTMNCLTRDGIHATKGIGRYVVACTWFQYLIAPIYGVDITGNTARPTEKTFDWDVVDDTNVNTIWNCVKAACQSPFAPTAIE